MGRGETLLTVTAAEARAVAREMAGDTTIGRSAGMSEETTAEESEREALGDRGGKMLGAQAERISVLWEAVGRRFGTRIARIRGSISQGFRRILRRMTCSSTSECLAKWRGRSRSVATRINGRIR